MKPISNKNPESLVILSKKEIDDLFAQLLDPSYNLISKLLYYCGLRLMECITLRIRDFKTINNRITIRNRYGKKDRYTIYPKFLQPDIENHIGHLKDFYNQHLTM